MKASKPVVVFPHHALPLPCCRPVMCRMAAHSGGQTSVLAATERPAMWEKGPLRMQPTESEKEQLFIAPGIGFTKHGVCVVFLDRLLLFVCECAEVSWGDYEVLTVSQDELG